MAMKGMPYHDVMEHNAARAKKAPKELDHLRLYPGENGGHIIEHHFKAGPMYQEAEKHPFSEADGKAVVNHMIEHGNIKGVTVAGEEE